MGIGPDAFADTARATALAVAMQRLSALPIDTAVTSVEEALSSRLPAIIVAPDGWNHPGIALPVSADDGSLTLDGVVGQGQSTTLTLDPELKYGALQAFFDGRRSLLVATSNSAPAQLDALLRWVSADPRRWSKVDGTAVISAPGHEPVVIGPQPGVAAAVPSSEGAAIAGWVAAAAVLAAVAVTALVVVRSRRG